MGLSIEPNKISEEGVWGLYLLEASYRVLYILNATIALVYSYLQAETTVRVHLECAHDPMCYLVW